MTSVFYKMPYKNALISEAFILALQMELEKEPEGISEYDLMRILKLQGYFDFLSSPALPHQLFCAHFILFHVLYLLRHRFLDSKKYLLDINTLKIKLLPYSKGQNSLQEDDKLKAYYLDLHNLEQTSEDDVYDMLASFWNNYNNFENRDDALAKLGLTEPVDDKTIKETYRRLVMKYHPDRGGDAEKVQSLNAAIKLLLG